MATDFDANTSLSEMSKLPGIADLPSAVKVPFMKALKAELAGDTATASAKLEEAIAKEAELQSEKKK